MTIKTAVRVLLGKKAYRNKKKRKTREIKNLYLQSVELGWEARSMWKRLKIPRARKKRKRATGGSSHMVQIRWIPEHPGKSLYPSSFPRKCAVFFKDMKCLCISKKEELGDPVRDGIPSSSLCRLTPSIIALEKKVISRKTSEWIIKNRFAYQLSQTVVVPFNHSDRPRHQYFRSVRRMHSLSHCFIFFSTVLARLHPKYDEYLKKFIILLTRLLFNESC